MSGLDTQTPGWGVATQGSLLPTPTTTSAELGDPGEVSGSLAKIITPWLTFLNNSSVDQITSVTRRLQGCGPRSQAGRPGLRGLD